MRRDIAVPAADAGGVNGDGLSDVIVGGVFADRGGLHGNGEALGTSPAGRVGVRLEWEIESLGTPLLLDTGALAGPAGNAAHWRLRIASRSPFFRHPPWPGPSGNGPQETDLRVLAAVSTGVDGPTRPFGGSLAVSVAPNPFNPRTTIAFERPRAGGGLPPRQSCRNWLARYPYLPLRDQAPGRKR